MDKNMRILVVDDFPTMRKIVINILLELGFNASHMQEADDGDTALAMLRGGSFDFLITDWNMPRMSGLDLVKTVRKDARLTKLPILMVTAEGKKEQIIMAAKAGANGYILKPFTAETMQTKLAKIFP